MQPEGTQDTFLAPLIYFNPRTSCEVRHAPREIAGHLRISIHTPHTKDNTNSIRIYDTISANFNPRTSYEVRQLEALNGAINNPFQSTHPMRGATRPQTTAEPSEPAFQSTHLMRGATDRAHRHRLYQLHFNPRTPYGVRLGNDRPCQRVHHFISIHTPRTVCDCCDAWRVLAAA